MTIKRITNALRWSFLLVVLESSIASPTLAQPNATNAVLRSIPDALELDVSAESVLARADLKGEQALSAGSVEELQKFLQRPKLGLIPSQDVQADADFGARIFVNSKLAAAKLLLRGLDAPETAPKASASQTPYPLSKLAELAGQRTGEKAFQAMDSWIELGWTNCARELICAVEPKLQVMLENGNYISWMEARSRIDRPDFQAKFIETAKARLTAGSNDQIALETVVQLWMRLVYCSLIEQDQSRFALEAEVANAVFGDAIFNASAKSQQTDAKSGPTVRETIARWSKELAERQASLKNSKDSRKSLSTYTEKILEQRFDQRYAPSRSLIPGFPSPPLVTTEPSTGETVVLARRSNKILRWQAGKTTAWPASTKDQSSSSIDLINVPELNLADEAKLGAMVVNHDHLFALVDSRQRSSAGSDSLRESLLVGLRIDKGLQLITTPISAKNTLATALKLKPKDTVTFLGTPLVASDQLFVLIADGVTAGIFRVASFQIPSMALAWISEPFGIEKTSELGVVSNTCLMLHQGRLFVAGGQGAVAALQADDGSIAFQVNYAKKKPGPYDRELAPLVRTTMVGARDVVVCGASDAATMFAVDWSDGHVHWSIDRDQFQRAPQLVGVMDNELLCMGDRLAWVNLDTGSPTAVVELTRAAVPMTGQAAIVGDDIVWSNGASVFSYPAKRQPNGRRYSIANKKDLERWHFSSVEPLAFSINERLISITTESMWLVFQSK